MSDDQYGYNEVLEKQNGPDKIYDLDELLKSNIRGDCLSSILELTKFNKIKFKDVIFNIFAFKNTNNICVNIFDTSITAKSLRRLETTYIYMYLSSTQRAYIRHIKKSTLLNGNGILELAINLIKVCGCNIIEIEDQSHVFCDINTDKLADESSTIKNPMALSILRTLEKGETFYEKYGFKYPENTEEILNGFGRILSQEDILKDDGYNSKEISEHKRAVHFLIEKLKKINIVELYDVLNSVIQILGTDNPFIIDPTDEKLKEFSYELDKGTNNIKLKFDGHNPDHIEKFSESYNNFIKLHDILKNILSLDGVKELNNFTDILIYLSRNHCTHYLNLKTAMLDCNLSLAGIYNISAINIGEVKYDLIELTYFNYFNMLVWQPLAKLTLKL